MKVKSLSRVLLFATWTVAYQAPLSMGFSRQEYWSGLPWPSPGDLSNPGIEPRSPELQADSLPSEPPGKTQHMISVQNLTLSLPTTLQERDRACVWEELGLPLSFCNFSVKERNKRERRRRNNYILANTLFFNNHRGISLIEILLQWHAQGLKNLYLSSHWGFLKNNLFLCLNTYQKYQDIKTSTLNETHCWDVTRANYH